METLKSLPDEIDSMSPVEAESLICKSILLNNRGIFKNEIDGKPVSKWSIILQNQLDNELEYNIKPKLRQPTAPTGKPTLKGFQSSLSINQIDRLYNSLQGVYIDNSSVNFDICI